MRPAVKLYRLGQLSYRKSLIAQQVLFDNLKRNTLGDLSSGINDGYNPSYRETIEKNITNSLILVEHDPVYTIGLRAQQYNDSYEFKLRATLDQYGLKADFVRTNRGGLVTFHGPGQLVAYPIIYLGDFAEAFDKRSIKKYVRTLETTIIETLNRVGLNGAHTVNRYPGVWLDNGERKVAFIGISCRRFVTMHGISINCDCDLSWFDHIVSCGIKDKAITSIRQELASTGSENNESKLFSNRLSDCEREKVNCNKHVCDDVSIGPVSYKLRAMTSPHDDFSRHPEHHQTNAFVPNESPVPYNISHIANQFCVSFSNNFKCDLQEEDFPWTLINTQCTDEESSGNQL